MAGAVSSAPGTVVAREMVANAPSRILSVNVRAARPVAAQPGGDGVGQADQLALDVGPVVEVVGERLLVADRLDLLVGLDRSVVAARGQRDEVLAVGPAEAADDDGRVERGEVADGGHPHAAQPLQRLRPDPPQPPHGEGMEVGQLLPGADLEDAGAGPDAVGAGPGLGLDRGQLGQELVRGHADRAREGQLARRSRRRIGRPMVTPSPSSARAPVTSRNASSSDSGSTSGVTASKIARTSRLASA